jgi:hypothetical protein
VWSATVREAEPRPGKTHGTTACYASSAAGDLTLAEPAVLRAVFDVAVTGLVSALQAALPDLRSAPGEAAVLVTGGGYGLYDTASVALAVKFGGMGLSVAKSPDHPAGDH